MIPPVVISAFMLNICDAFYIESITDIKHESTNNNRRYYSMKRLTYEDEFSIVSIENKEEEGDTLEVDSIGNFIEHMVKPLLQGMTYSSTLVEGVTYTPLSEPTSKYNPMDDYDYNDEEPDCSCNWGGA